MEHAGSSRTEARWLAPLAVVVVAIATLIVAAGAAVDDDAGSSATGTTSGTVQSSSGSGGGKKKAYVVKPGDTLSSIAAKTGVSVEQLQTLNPDIDPQALASGQRLKLR